MVIDPVGGDTATSAPGEVPLYAVCTRTDGYGCALTRFPDESSIELMVEDQTNLPTQSPRAVLYRDRLTLELKGEDAASAARIGVPTAYTVLLRLSPERMLELDATLAQIFAGVGEYRREF
jgi:hypothetical protein